MKLKLNLLIVIAAIALTSATTATTAKLAAYVEYYHATEALLHAIETDHPEVMDTTYSGDEFYYYNNATQTINTLSNN